MYCQDENNFSYLFHTVEEVHHHWSSMHLNEDRSFRFYVEKFASCFYCGFDSTFIGLKEHHTIKHSTKSFIIVNQSNQYCCGICQYSGYHLMSHFKLEHEIVIKANIFNPIEITDDELNRLTNSNEIELICDHCHTNIQPNEYFTHIFCHDHEFSCASCDYMSFDIIQVIGHEKEVHHLSSSNYLIANFINLLRKQYFRSKILFGNGLVANKHSLMSTKYNDSKHFDEFIMQLKDHWKERITKELVHGTFDVENSKKLTIYGIPSFDSEDLMLIFLNLCIRLKADISMDDIHRIYRHSSHIIVEMNEIETKQRILKKKFMNNILLGDLIKLPSNRDASNIESSEIFIFN